MHSVTLSIRRLFSLALLIFCSLYLIFGIVPSQIRAENAPTVPGTPIRVGSVVGGHIHPALCRAANGDLLAVYNENGGGGK